MNVLGTEVTITNLPHAADTVCSWIDGDDARRFMCVVDVHCIVQAHRRPEVRHAYNTSDACVPDGMPLTWVGRRRGHKEIGRVYGPDLMLTLLGRSADTGYRNFFLGGNEGVADDLKRRMEERFPGLHVVGTLCPPFRELSDAEKDEMVAEVNATRPDLLWVALGAPKQDLFMREYYGRFNAKVMIGVGAAFDFHTGRVPQAPRWMMKMGLEWFFRFCMEPRRLGPRYLRHNPVFMWNIFLQETGLRSYAAEIPRQD